MKNSIKILKNRNEEIKLKFGVDRNKREYTWKKFWKQKNKIESGLNLLKGRVRNFDHTILSFFQIILIKIINLKNVLQ